MTFAFIEGGYFLTHSDEATISSSEIVSFIGIWGTVSLVMTCVYAYFYVRQDKHVVWLEKLQSYDSSAWTSFSATFGVVAIAPTIISLFSVGIHNIFFILLTALFAVSFPAMVVDAIYGAIWVRKHPYEVDDSSMNTSVWNLLDWRKHKHKH